MGNSRFEHVTRERTVTDAATAHDAIRELHRSVEEMRKVEHLDGRILERTDPNDRNTKHISLVPSATGGTIVKIPHGLNRPLRGWSVKDVLADGATSSGEIQRVTTDGTNVCDESREIWLKAYGYASAAAVKVRIHVY